MSWADTWRQPPDGAAIVPNTLNKIRLHNELIAIGMAGPFFRTTYDCVTNLADEIDENAAPEVVQPSSVKANEIRSGFGVATSHRRSHARDRATWTWHLMLKFNCEVTAERVEETLLANPPCLAMLGDNNQTRQIRLDLVSSDYTHPPTQKPHSGSDITLTFEAVALRR